MPSPPAACLVLRDSDTDELVVTADFAATGRTAATFHDLVDLLSVEANIWEIAPLRYGDEPGVTGADQVARWIGDIRASGLRVGTVIGFCGGSVYAAELAERIAGWQDDPALILLDPGIPVPKMLTEHVAGWARRVEPTLDHDDAAQLHALIAATGAADATPLELAGNLGALFRSDVAPALRGLGYETATIERFAALVNGYLHWLAGAMQLDPRPRWRTAPTLHSNSPGFGLFLAPPPERATLVGETTWFDVTHFELMRSPEVGALVDRLLTRTAAPVS